MEFSRSRRIIRPELLDDAPGDEVARNLREIAFLNRWFGGHRITVRMLQRHVRTDEEFTLLDVGAASGDFARVIQRTFTRARITCLDRQERNLAIAPRPKVVADAFHLPYKDGSFDFVHCSLFLHHFADEGVRELLAGMKRVASRAVVVQDLERHPLAYRFLPWTRRVFGWSDLVLHDGPVSVAAAFRADELAKLARGAGIANPDVRRHGLCFRLSLSGAAD